jgi:protein SCO1/2
VLLTPAKNRIRVLHVTHAAPTGLAARRPCRSARPAGHRRVPHLSPKTVQVAGSSVGGPFRLTTGDGKVLTERDLLGTPYLVFFGFTHCPDICPTKLLELSEVLRATGERGRTLRALFITVDPERDSPEIMKSYVSSFDDRIVGLTGDRAAVDAAVKTFRAYAKKVPLKDGDYTMDHTALVYLMGKDGRFVNSFNVQRPPAAAAAELLRYL